MIWLYRRLLDRCLAKLVRRGSLLVVWPDGSRNEYGGTEGFRAGIHLKTNEAVKRMSLNPGLALGEAYMDGSLLPLNGSIHDVLCVMLDNLNDVRLPLLAITAQTRRLLRPILQANDAHRAKRNVAHHYDLNGRLYSLFLDRDRQYSCGYFPRGDETIDEAQVAKKRHIAAKLLLNRPDLRVLDIGCGWGGLALTLARDYGARVTGITLSTEQLAEARARAKAEGLDDRVTFELMDYRSMTRCYDRIVSVGMFEHVGVGHYQQFFEVVKRCLAPDGVALLHAIGRSDGPSSTNPWIAKYIFPGGYCPSLSEVFPAIEKTGLIATDLEVLRLHYAETLRHWRRRFMANRDAIATIYDERFCRMFEFYLAGCELAFRRQHHMIFQIQLTREQTAAPLTRDYITDTERTAARSKRVDA